MFLKLAPSMLRPSPIGGLAPPAVATRVFDAQVGLLYRLAPASLLFSVVAATLVCWLLSDVVDTTMLFGWWCLGLLLNTLRLVLVRAFRRVQTAAINTKRWAYLFIVGTGLNGILWGICAVVLLPRDQPEVEFALLTILAVIPGIAFSSMAAIRAAYLAFVIPFVGPLAAVMLITGEGSELIIGVAAVVFLCVLWIIAKRGEQDVISTYAQRFANEDLMIDLQEARAHEQQVSQDLAAEVRERRHMEDQLRVAKDAAEQASQAKSLFLASMSHEIRTPLNGVIGMTDLLQRTPLTAKQQRYVAIAQQSGNALLTIINDILDFSKIEVGKVELECIPFDLRQVVNNVRDLFLESAKSKELAFSCTVEANVPALLCGDPARLRQVLTNLVSNAVKFTAAGEVRLRVQRRESTGSHLCPLRITVRDTGVGMDEQARRDLFTPFSQADSSTTRRFGGTGLGLAITRQLVELMGGSIDVDSRLGEGACFRIDLELGIEDRANAAGSPDVTAPEDVPRDGVVLVVEDNPVNLFLAEAMLQELGCRVLTAENGEQALATLRSRAVDLVLMDCEMPVMDGYETTQRYREEERRQGAAGVRLPIVAITASAIQGDRERCLEVGMDDYLPKPFVMAGLRDVLVRWLPSERALRPSLRSQVGP